MHPSPTPPLSILSRPRALPAAAAWVAALGYIALTLTPPGPSPLAPPPFDASWTDRVFPGVPAAWVWWRLGAWLACIAAAAWATAGRWHEGAREPTPPLAAGNRMLLGFLLLWTAAQAVVGVFGPPLPRAIELAYIAALAVPAVAMRLAERGTRRPRQRRSVHPAWVLVGLMIAAWTIYRASWSGNAYRVPTGTDYAMAFEYLQRTLQPDFSLLAGSQNPGFTAMLSVLQGPVVFGIRPDELRLGHMQIVQILWAGVTAGMLARWSTRAFGVWSAPVVVASFLASTAVAMTTIFVAALFLGPLLATALALLWQRIEAQGAPWAILAFATIAGSCFTHPSLYPTGALALAALAGHWWASPDRRHPLWMVAALSLLAVLAPVLMSFGPLERFGGTYFEAKQMWSGMEAAAFGMIPPSLLEFHLQTGRTSVFDLVTGMLLAPGLTPRTAMRATADGWFDPIGAALVALGLGAVLGNLRRSRGARAVGLFLAVTIVPGFISSYDRPSVTRALALPATLAILAGLGAAWSLRLVAPRWAGWWSGCIAVACFGIGTAVFDILQPKLLPAAGLSTILENVDAGPSCRPAALIGWPGDAMFDELYATQVPRCPLTILEPGALTEKLAQRDGRILYWRPNLEDEIDVRRQICLVDGQQRIFTLWDRPGTIPAFAAALGDAAWEPELPVERWRETTCDEELPTEAQRARRVLAEAKALDTDTAIARLRPAAQGSFAQVALYLELARLLLERGTSPDAGEALRWTEYAAAVVKWSSPEAVRLHARATSILGRRDEHRGMAERSVAKLRSIGRIEEAEALEREMKGLGLDPP